MAAITATASDSYYGSDTTWSQRTAMELTADYARWGRLTMPSLAGGKLANALSLRFNKTSSGGGGPLRLYASTDAGIVPNMVTSNAIYVGETAAFGSGAEWKTIVLTADMTEVLSRFTGTFYLYLACSVYVTFSGYGASAPYLTGTAYDGTIWENVGGIWRKGNVWENVGGVWRQGLQWQNVGGVWKKGITS